MSAWTTPVTWANGGVTAATINTEVRDHLNWLKAALDILTNGSTADTGDTALIHIKRAGAADRAVVTQLTADAGLRFKVAADGNLAWSPGTSVFDTVLTRTAAGAFKFSSNATANATQVAVEATSGQRGSVEVQVAGDTASRAVLWGDATTTGLEFGPGSGTRDVLLRRSAANELELASTPGTVLVGTGGSTSSAKFAARVTGDAEYRWAARSDGQLQWGDGSVARDVNLFRPAANILRTDDHLVALDGVQTKSVAGVVSDASFTVTPASGTIAIDTTNSRIYVRVGSTWKSVAVA